MSIGDDDISRSGTDGKGENKSCLIMGIIIGSVGGVILLCGGCCFGFFYFRASSVADDITTDLQGNSVMGEHIGEVESLETDFSSFSLTDDEYVFRVSGTLNSGTITAECIEDDVGVFHVLWGQLELDTGEVYDLFPDGRSDLDLALTADYDQFWSDSFSQEVIDRLVKEDLANQAVIVEHIGEIQRLASDMQLSVQEPGDIWVFDITGEKGGGLLRANCVLVADNDIDVDSAVLILDSGEHVQLFPEAPMDALPDRTDPAPETEPIEP